MQCALHVLERFPHSFTGKVRGARAPDPRMRLPYEQVGASDRTVTAEACVVGSGAAGAIAAMTLAQRGMKVVVMESGPYVDPAEFDQLEANMVPLLYKDGGAQLTMDLSLGIAQGRCLGGSTVINDAVCFAPPEGVLDEWVERSGVEWLRWSSLRPDVERVWDYLKVARVPDSQVKGHNKILRDGCAALGIPHHGPNYRNCLDCCECALCHLGCAYDTKRSMLVTAIPDALAAGADFYTDCAAVDIEVAGGRATGVRCVVRAPGASSGARLSVKASTVVVAAGTIASSGILLRTRGLPPLLVGSGVALHPSPLVIGVFEEPVNAHQAIPMAYHCHEWGALNGVVQGGFMLESIFLPPMQFAAALPSLGESMLRDMKLYTRMSPVGMLIRDRPTGEVTLGREDEPVLDYRVGKPEKAALARAMSKAVEVLFAAGARRVLTSHRERVELTSPHETPVIGERGTGSGELWMGSAHPQGGNPLGMDRGRSVVDQDGRVHGLANLYVCDASVFPSAVGVNPQITVMAIAGRIARAAAA